MITCSKCGSRVGVTGPCRKCQRNAREASKAKFPGGMVGGVPAFNPENVAYVEECNRLGAASNPVGGE